MPKAEKQRVGLWQLLVCDLPTPARKQSILFLLAVAFAAGHSLPLSLKGPLLVFWLLCLCPPLSHFSPFQTTCSLNLSLSHPVTHSLHPLLQIHMGNLLTLASPDHAAGALHSFPLCLPCLLGQQALHGIPVDSIPLLNTDI